MSSKLEELKDGVFDLIEWGSGPYAQEGNGVKLLDLDFDEVGREIKTLEDKIEDMEYDSFVIDKMMFERVFSNMLKKLMYDEDGYLIPMDRDELFEEFHDKFLHLLMDDMERVNGK